MTSEGTSVCLPVWMYTHITRVCLHVPYSTRQEYLYVNTIPRNVYIFIIYTQFHVMCIYLLYIPAKNNYKTHRGDTCGGKSRRAVGLLLYVNTIPRNVHIFIIYNNPTALFDLPPHVSPRCVFLFFLHILKKALHTLKRALCALKMWYHSSHRRWGAGVETQKNVRGEIGGWGRVPFNEPYAPSLSTIYDGA